MNLSFLKYSALLFTILISNIHISKSQTIKLTPQEKEWLENNRNGIFVATECNTKPYIYKDSSGVFRGLSIDILNEIEKLISVNFILQDCQPFHQVLESGYNKQTTLITSIKNTKTRREHLVFSQIYIEIPVLLIGKNKLNKTCKLDELGKNIVAVSKHSLIHEYIAEKHPKLNLHLEDTEYESIEQIILGNVNYTITDAASLSVYKKENPKSNLKVYDAVPTSFSLGFAAHKDNQILIGIIDKALDNISDEKKHDILNKWVELEINEKSNLAYFIWSASIVLIIISSIYIFVKIWNRSLQKKVNEKTKQLESEFERRKLMEINLSKKNTDIKKIKKIADLNEETFKSLYNQSPLSIQFFDKNGLTIDVNKAYEKLWNINKEDVIGKYNILKDPYAKSIGWMDYIKRAFDGEVVETPVMEYDPTQMGYRARKRFLHSTVFPIIESKKVEQVVFIHQDVTEIKKYELQLTKAKNEAVENEKYKKMLFENSAIGLVVTKMTGELIEINQAFADIIGYSIEETLKLSYWDITPKKYEDEEQIQLDLLNTKGAYGPYEKEYIHKSGKLIPVRLQGTIIDRFGEKCTWSSVEDISEKKHQEEKLKNQNEEYAALNEEYLTQNEELQEKNIEFLRAKELAEDNEKKFTYILDNTNITIYSLNLKTGTYDYLSPSVKEIYGYTPKEFIEGGLKTSIERFHPEDVAKIENHLNGLLEHRLEDFSPTVIYRFKHPQKGYRWMSDTRGVIFDSDKNPINLIGFAFDITDQKTAEEKILLAKEEAERSNRLKTEFINNMSHEIRTPMNGIIGFSDFLKEPDLSQEKRQNYIKIIQNSGNQLLKIIDDILEISKLGTKQIKVENTKVCINDLLTDLFSIFDIKAREQKIPLYLKKPYSDQDSTINTDSTKLNKILSNLIENALKFTNEGYIEIGYEILNNDIQIYIKDTGIGIDEGMHEKIFERFTQENQYFTSIGGLGLGLSIAKENTELLGGKINLASVKGHGSTFFLTIPTNKEKMHRVINEDNIHEIEKSERCSILVAEDEEVNYLYIETLLMKYKNNKCNIIHAKNGAEAVDKCKTNSINLVLMDLKMPKMDGFMATKEIRQKFPDLPIIAQTAYTSSEDKEKAINSGCNDFIEKPIKIQEFYDLLNKYFTQNGK